MKIELEEPFKSLWDKGYLTINGEGRRIVSLHKPGASFGTSYARYLMGVKLGYLVPDHLEVDHKDDDKTNDDINNLQLLTGEQNLLKKTWDYIENKQVCYGCECINCGTRFILTERQVNMRLAQKVENVFCSKSCSAKYHSLYSDNQTTKGISQESIDQIKRLRASGLSVYKIAEVTGFSRNTIMKYWKERV